MIRSAACNGLEMVSRIVLLLCCFGLVLCAGGCTTLPSVGLSGVTARKANPFVVAKSASSLGWGYFSHASAAKTFSDEIAVCYYSAGDAGSVRLKAEFGDERAPAFSHDGGISWKYGIENSRAGRHAIPLTYANDYYVSIPFDGDAYWTVNGSVGRINGITQLKPMALIANDGVVSNWVAQVHLGKTGSCGYATTGARMLNGDLVMAAWLACKMGKRRALLGNILLKSTDGGQNFNVHSQIATPDDSPWGNEGPNESALVRLPNDELVCVMRTGSPQGARGGKRTSAAHSMLIARSMDGGETWEKRKLRIPGVRPNLCLMNNGVLALSFGRPGNSIIFSTNGGRTWGSEIALTAGDLRSSGYVGLIEVEPGRLLAVYDGWNTPTRKIWLWEPKEINTVWGVFVDVYRLWGGDEK